MQQKAQKEYSKPLQTREKQKSRGWNVRGREEGKIGDQQKRKSPLSESNKGPSDDNSNNYSQTL